MKKLTRRQNLILEFIREKQEVSNREVKAYLDEKGESLDRATIVRDIDFLLELNLIEKSGAGRNIVYREKLLNPMLAYFDPQKYFEIEPDNRDILYENFNFNIFSFFKNNLFLEDELEKIDKKNKNYLRRVEKISETILKKEYERLSIELSWKSSQIEGNTYTLLDTEFLIRENREASGHSREEAIMILNHKKALDYIIENKKDFKELSLSKIENIHKILVGNLGIKENIRQRTVAITGTKFKPLDNEFQIREAIEKMIKIVNNNKAHPIVKALMVVLLVSYIQPFEDGNKRTARLLGNAILLANNYCPLSYRSVDEKEYKKAMLLFYEQNSALFFKELFVKQFEFSVDNYFL